MKRKNLYSLLFLVFFAQWGVAQVTTIYGRVIDAKTQEPIAFANIVIQGTAVGTTSDFEGHYELVSNESVDSVVVLFLGYEKRVKPIKIGVKQELNFQLQPTDFQLEMVDILPGENPAHRILKNVWANQEKNDIRSLSSYQYESYTKVQVDADNISSKFRNKRIMKPFDYLFDSLEIAAGEDGNPILPIFVSETLSDYYFEDDPPRKKENIRATNVTGVGLQDGSYISQFVGSSFHDYNFYKNNLTLLERNIVSPISTEAIGFYIHILEDSLWIGNRWCYQIKLVPKRKEDLVFNGTIWIQDTTWALVKLSVEVDGNANLNFIERLKIQQELAPSDAGPWVPVKTRILMDVEEPTKETFGMLAKVYISNKDVKVNQTFAPKFFKNDVTVDRMALARTDTFWERHRHEALTQEDQTIYSLIDSIRDFPRVRTYIEIAQVLSTGYIGITPKLDYGSFLLSYGTNIVEKHRLRAGFRTTGSFSKRFTLRGYGAYGFRDDRFKYGVVSNLFLDRKTWTKVGYQYKRDLEGIGALDDYEDLNPLLEAATQLGLLERMNRVELHRGWFHTDLHRSVTQKVIFTSKHYTPEGAFVFAYYPDVEDPETVRSTMQTTEVALETRWSPLETKLINDNRRSSVNVNKAPSFTFRYALGLQGLLGGDFAYHKFGFQVKQIARLGVLGRAEYIAKYDKTFTPLPYLLLNVFPGNETFIRTLATYNLMDFFEFVADESFMLFYVHHFDGILANRVPLLRKLKWRTVLSGKMALGSLSDNNLRYLAENDAQGRAVTPVRTLKPWQPYYEIGYGFENIFRFLRIQAYHRLSYLDDGANSFGVKGSVYFNF